MSDSDIRFDNATNESDNYRRSPEVISDRESSDESDTDRRSAVDNRNASASNVSESESVDVLCNRSHNVTEPGTLSSGDYRSVSGSSAIGSGFVDAVHDRLSDTLPGGNGGGGDAAPPSATGNVLQNRKLNRTHFIIFIDNDSHKGSFLLNYVELLNGIHLALLQSIKQTACFLFV